MRQPDVNGLRFDDRQSYRDWAEAQPRGRFEWEHGVVIAMSPERLIHVRLKTNIVLALHGAIRKAGVPCEVFTDGATVEVGDDIDYEPDALVNCGERGDNNAIAVPNPVIVVEVLSPSTRYRGLGVKVVNYFRVPSIQHYLIVSADRMRVVHHRRGTHGPVEASIVPSGLIDLTPPGITIAVADIYAGSPWMPPRMRHSLSCLLAALLAGAALPAAAQPAAGTHEMAATANPLATDAALAVLQEGGSAVDAAVAGQMMLAVVEPQSSGLGGGSLLLVWDAKAHDLAFYEGLASAPAGTPRDYARTADGQPIPPAVLDRSGRAVAVPGTLRTLAMVHARYGRLPWARLFQGAIHAAEDGFPMPPYLHATLLQRRDLAGKPALSAYFSPDGTPLDTGTTLTNPALAATLRRVAAEGADAIYTGPIAADIVAAVAAGSFPGTLTLADLAAYQPRQRAPVCLQAFGRRICTASPPVSGGVALLEELAVLDRVGIAQTAPGSPAAAHLLLEAARLSEADRRAFIGDPDQVLVPTDGLLDPAYLDSRARAVDPAHAAAKVEPGNPPARHASLPQSDPAAMPATTHLAIIDRHGNAVSFTTTINLNFGADLLADGIVLNDALTNFATTPVVRGQVVANAAAPGKRPITTMAPTIVFGRDGEPELIVGAGGGARIIDAVAQTIVGVLAWNQDVRTAIEQPRIGGQNRAEELELGTPAMTLADALRAMGHTVRTVPMNAGVQAIAVTPQGLRGWADPHRDGVARGN